MKLSDAGYLHFKLVKVQYSVTIGLESQHISITCSMNECLNSNNTKQCLDIGV